MPRTPTTPPCTPRPRRLRRPQRRRRRAARGLWGLGDRQRPRLERPAPRCRGGGLVDGRHARAPPRRRRAVPRRRPRGAGHGHRSARPSRRGATCPATGAACRKDMAAQQWFSCADCRDNVVGRWPTRKRHLTPIKSLGLGTRGLSLRADISFSSPRTCAAVFGLRIYDVVSTRDVRSSAGEQPQRDAQCLLASPDINGVLHLPSVVRSAEPKRQGKPRI